MPDNIDVNVETNAKEDEAGTAPLDYSAWVEEQPGEVKTMLSGWEGGLKTALKAERDRAKSLDKQLRDAAKKLEEGSEERIQLEAIADELADARRESSFYELAHIAGANNIKLLYVAAKQDELVRKDGSSDFAQLKTIYPQLFGITKIVPKGNAGEGGVDPPAGKKDMNAFIRQSSGRRP